MEAALTEGTWKCIVDAEGQAKVWDLAADPFELSDGSAHPDRAAACAEKVRAMVAAQETRATELGAGQTREMDPATVEQLRLLGYTEEP